MEPRYQGTMQDWIVWSLGFLVPWCRFSSRQGQKTAAAIAQPMRCTTCSVTATRISPRGRSRTASASSTDRKSTRLNSSHVSISYAVFCLKKKTYNTLIHYYRHAYTAYLRNTP